MPQTSASSSLGLYAAATDTEQHVDITKQQFQVSDPLEEQAVTLPRSPTRKAAVLSFG